MDYVESNKVMTILVVAIVVVMLFTTFTIPLAQTAARMERGKRDKLEAAIENNYTAYLDGNEVDISKLNAYDYVVTIDNESKSIYLKDKGFWDLGQCINFK